MTWIEKYRPKKFSEIKGQEIALEKIKNFLKTFDRLRQGEGHKLTQEEIKEINERMMKKMKKRDEELGFKTEVLDVEKIGGIN